MDEEIRPYIIQKVVFNSQVGLEIRQFSNHVLIEFYTEDGYRSDWAQLPFWCGALYMHIKMREMKCEPVIRQRNGEIVVFDADERAIVKMVKAFKIREGI